MEKSKENQHPKNEILPLDIASLSEEVINKMYSEYDRNIMINLKKTGMQNTKDFFSLPFEQKLRIVNSLFQYDFKNPTGLLKQKRKKELEDILDAEFSKLINISVKEVNRFVPEVFGKKYEDLHTEREKYEWIIRYGEFPQKHPEYLAYKGGLVDKELVSSYEKFLQSKNPDTENVKKIISEGLVVLGVAKLMNPAIQENLDSRLQVMRNLEDASNKDFRSFSSTLNLDEKFAEKYALLGILPKDIFNQIKRDASAVESDENFKQANSESYEFTKGVPVPETYFQAENAYIDAFLRWYQESNGGQFEVDAEGNIQSVEMAAPEYYQVVKKSLEKERNTFLYTLSQLAVAYVDKMNDFPLKKYAIEIVPLNVFYRRGQELKEIVLNKIRQKHVNLLLKESNRFN